MEASEVVVLAVATVENAAKVPTHSGETKTPKAVSLSLRVEQVKRDLPGNTIKPPRVKREKRDHTDQESTIIMTLERTR